jgi:hypothetical protein
MLVQYYVAQFIMHGSSTSMERANPSLKRDAAKARRPLALRWAYQEHL